MTLFIVAAGIAPAGADPQLNTIPDKRTPYPGRPYHIDYEVSWAGEPAEYAVSPPDLPEIEWGSIEVVQTRAFIRDGLNIVASTVEVTPQNDGEFELPEFSIRLKRPEEPNPPTPRTGPESLPVTEPSPPLSSDSTTLSVPPLTLVVQPSRARFVPLGGLGAFLLVLTLGVGCLVLRRRRSSRGTKSDRAPGEAGPSLEDLKAAQSRLNQCKKTRLEGDYYEFYLGLSQAAGHLSGELEETLRQRATQVGYGNVRPTEDEMDADVRAVERMLSACSSS